MYVEPAVVLKAMLVVLLLLRLSSQLIEQVCNVYFVL